MAAFSSTGFTWPAGLTAVQATADETAATTESPSVASQFTAILKASLETVAYADLRAMLEHVRCEIYDRERRPKM